MSILDTLFGRPGTQGHWDNVGPFGRLHTRSLPQMGCQVCEAEGWIPAISKGNALPGCDCTDCHLIEGRKDIQRAIGHLELATDDSRVDPFVRRVALDALRDALTAVEAEMEQGHDPS